VTTALLGFALASTLVILAPGPDSMLVMRNTMRAGRRAGWVTACGTLSGLTIWALAGALGLSALLRVSHVGYDILRFCGAAYLIWLGVTSLAHLRRKTTAGPAAQASGSAPAEPAQASGSAAAEPAQASGSAPAAPGLTGAGTARQGRAYLTGLLSNLLNPKISVFFMAFLPAFVPAGASAAGFSLVLGIWFIAETGLWLAVVAWLADRGVRWLRRPAVQRWMERVTGIVLIGFGLRLATESRRFA
jgi:threonine/homoserine/homoserine lactone efflux protein